MRRHLIVYLLLLLAFESVGAVDGDSLLHGSSLMGGGACAEISIDMTISSTRGEKTRTLKVYRDERDDTQKVLVQITRPAFLQNMKLLSITDDERTTRWLKNSYGVNRLTSSDQDQPLFDSDFSTGDLMRIDTDVYDISVMAEAPDMYQLHTVNSVTGESMDITLERPQLLITDITFYDRDGNKQKIYQVHEFQRSEGYLMPKVSTMSQCTGASKTTLVFTDITLKDSISPRYFNSHTL